MDGCVEGTDFLLVSGGFVGGWLGRLVGGWAGEEGERWVGQRMGGEGGRGEEQTELLHVSDMLPSTTHPSRAGALFPLLLETPLIVGGAHNTLPMDDVASRPSAGVKRRHFSELLARLRRQSLAHSDQNFHLVYALVPKHTLLIITFRTTGSSSL